MISIREHCPSVQEYNALRESVGWHSVTEEAVWGALSSSLFLVSALDDDRLCGFARVVGDGALYFFGQDLMVHPDYQRKGIGRRLICAVQGYLAGVMTEDSSTCIVAASGKAEL